ncbi:phage replisome organizer N-terminal domain-containing protein [Phascolarctobacterium sp.]|uniref:phage replisome organizer N-terminal domain-containing protein n=1 Tax=Phascolarctobacterium sp. TaxID=2049039 RepID=UPI0038652FC6
MSDNQKYYYMRLKESFFDDDAVKILEAMPDGYLYSNILLKLYLKSLKFNGRLMYNERIPYNAGVLATLTNHSVGVVEKALKTFEDLGLIEVLDNGAIYMLDIQNYIGKSSTEADRKREYRNQIEEEKQLLLGQMSGQMSDKIPPEIEIKKEKEIETETESRERIDYQRVAALYNDTCVSFPRLKSLSDTRKKAIKARLKTYTYEDFKTLFTKAEASDFLKGKNGRDWQANFDWLIKDANMAKVLEGNYDNKASNGRKEPTPKWMSKDQQQYDFDEIERTMSANVGNSPELRERADALKQRLAQ